ncbi:SRPBCC family protein [Stappia sp.]|uniref:SRPBCC family protein n=1 Tax=Stappia sp. TaxID=1870903 RepID=UPI003D0FEDEE
MTELANLEAHGTLIEPATLEIRRVLPASVERVWDYLTDSKLRRQWLASGDMTMKAGTSFELVWRNDELASRPSQPGNRPEGYGDEERMDSRIVELDPPRRLVITWEGDGEVAFELAPRGNETLLTIVHNRLASRGALLGVSAGWHMHLDILLARMNAREPEPFWDGWKRLRAEYDQRFSA